MEGKIDLYQISIRNKTGAKTEDLKGFSILNFKLSRKLIVFAGFSKIA